MGEGVLVPLFRFEITHVAIVSPCLSPVEHACLPPYPTININIQLFPCSLKLVYVPLLPTTVFLSENPGETLICLESVATELSRESSKLGTFAWEDADCSGGIK